ncbi:MAG: 16S rRNA (uracil(1498)-N(3))-methyltransferase [Actinomycetales bacterium]|nr:16S rRNA (uracil(1498)-N(3))-methyltransferase [Actinomycetales bacterium]
MTLPVFLYQEPMSVDAFVTLSGDEGKHAATVRRIRVGEQIELVDGAGTRATCVVTVVSKHELTVRIAGVSFTQAPDLQFYVAQALAKGDRSDLALEILTEIGIDGIIPWSATHSIAKWSDPEKGQAKWQRVVTEASKQSRRAYVPCIAPLHSTEQLLSAIGANNLAIVLHEAASESITEITLPQAGQVLLVVGPEGGITGEEISAMKAAGAKVVRMGTSVMRTSTAGGAALAALISQTNRWAASDQK